MVVVLAEWWRFLLSGARSRRVVAFSSEWRSCSPSGGRSLVSEMEPWISKVARSTNVAAVFCEEKGGEDGPWRVGQVGEN